jgi:putative ABC transport system substrate-binding protein
MAGSGGRGDGVIRRRKLTLASTLALLLVSPLCHAQSGAGVRRVGLLLFASEAMSTRVRAAFKESMRELGWVEGKNIEYRYVFANGQADRLDALADELVAQKVEAIVAASSPSVRAAQHATKTGPIVMTNIVNAVGAGFVASLARPGGNITGITSQVEELLGKLIGIVHEVAPGARRVAVLVNESNPSHATLWAAAQRACTTLDLVAIRVVASEPSQLDLAIPELVRQRAQAVVVVPDGMFFNERTRLQQLIHPTRLPVGYALREHVDAGGLLSYAADLTASFRYAAKYVNRILKGAKPADLPVEQPTTFELVINLGAAKSLGIVVPQGLLLRADEVIQ